MFVRNCRVTIFLCCFFVYSCDLLAYTVLIYGSKGWIGNKIKTILLHEGHEVHEGNARLQERERLEAEIVSIRPDYIINSAGVIGKPNVDWCETNKQETVRSNVLGLLNIVDLAFLHNIHITNIATGCIYTYDEQHSLGSGIGFTEQEKPNFVGSFYSRTKVAVEELIMNYPNVLQLRVRLPVSHDLSPNSFVGKIIKYKKLVNIPNSMSALEELLPLVPHMLDRKLTGIYNFVNPGTISHQEVIELYKKYVDPTHYYELFSLAEHDQMMKVPRSHCQLSAQKLLEQFPDIINIKDAFIRLFEVVEKEKGNT